MEDNAYELTNRINDSVREEYIKIDRNPILTAYLDKGNIGYADLIDITQNRNLEMKNMYEHKIYLEAMRNISVINYIRYLNGELDVFVCPKTMQLVMSLIDIITRTNVDWFSIVSGNNGSGKSTFSYSFIDAYCKLLGMDTNKAIRDNTIYDESDFFTYLANIDKKKPLEPVFLDEGANILFNRESMSKNRRWILKFINVMRFLNKLVVITSLKARMIDLNIRSQRVKSVFYISDTFDTEEDYRLAYYYEGPQIRGYYRFEDGAAKVPPDTNFILQFRENMEVADIVLSIKKKYTMKLKNQAMIELLKMKIDKLNSAIDLRKKINEIEKYKSLSIDENIKKSVEDVIFSTQNEVNAIELKQSEKGEVNENDSNNL